MIRLEASFSYILSSALSSSSLLQDKTIKAFPCILALRLTLDLSLLALFHYSARCFLCMLSLVLSSSSPLQDKRTKLFPTSSISLRLMLMKSTVLSNALSSPLHWFRSLSWPLQYLDSHYVALVVYLLSA